MVYSKSYVKKYFLILVRFCVLHISKAQTDASNLREYKTSATSSNLSVLVNNQNNITAVTKTTNGAYEHTKYICDGLLGAEILSISFLQLNDHDFIKTLIKHPNGGKETVENFSIKEETPASYRIDSHRNLDRYSTSSTYHKLLE